MHQHSTPDGGEVLPLVDLIEFWSEQKAIEIQLSRSSTRDWLQSQDRVVPKFNARRSNERLAGGRSYKAANVEL